MITGKLTKLLDTTLKVSRELPRNYIGASSIGSECFRKIWYLLKNMQGIEPAAKVKRTWDIGKRLEEMIVDCLEEVGVFVIRPSLENHYLEFFDAELPYFRGHADGLIYDSKYILEIKTAKNSSFNIFVNQGCKKWNQTYYAQIQSYMGMSGIHQGYILALNKDTSIFHDELIKFDKKYYEDLKFKAEIIFEATTPPPKVSASPLWYQCKNCQFKKICHNL